MINDITRLVRIIAERTDGNYTVYVSQDLNTEEYILCTRLPNWQIPDLFVGDEGFLQYKEVEAGDSAITPTGEVVYYKYSNSYIINFVARSSSVKKEIIL